MFLPKKEVGMFTNLVVHARI